jgi:putative transposase
MRSDFPSEGSKPFGRVPQDRSLLQFRMAFRGNVFQQDQYYHIYNRGASHGRIFFTDDNYMYCLRLVKKHRIRYEMSVIAYCLMPNHYHFLLRQDGNQPVSRFMQTLFNSYVQALNKQRNRSGTLFEGRFKHVHVDRTDYLVYLCRYIHLNPVRADLVSRPELWPYSNYLDVIERRSGVLKDEAFYREMFDTPADYAAFVGEGLEDPPEIEKFFLD